MFYQVRNQMQLVSLVLRQRGKTSIRSFKGVHRKNLIITILHTKSKMGAQVILRQVQDLKTQLTGAMHQAAMPKQHQKMELPQIWNILITNQNQIRISMYLTQLSLAIQRVNKGPARKVSALSTDSKKKQPNSCSNPNIVARRLDCNQHQFTISPMHHYRRTEWNINTFKMAQETIRSNRSLRLAFRTP